MTSGFAAPNQGGSECAGGVDQRRLRARAGGRAKWAMSPETPATVGSSVPASGTRGCSGSEDGLEDGHAALDHRLEESDRLGEEFVSEAQRVPGAGASRCNSIAFGILTARRGRGEKRL